MAYNDIKYKLMSFTINHVSYVGFFALVDVLTDCQLNYQQCIF